jgi:hypothetical protein
MVNAEKPWKGGGNQDTALNMMQTIKAALGNRGLGFTSYGGGPPFHPNFPWSEFATYADFGCPQIYDMQNNLSENYPTAAMAHWAELFDVNVPAWTAGSSKTPAGMIDIQDRTPLTRLAACWWSYRAAMNSPGRAQVIRDYKLAYPAIA